MPELVAREGFVTRNICTVETDNATDKTPELPYIPTSSVELLSPRHAYGGKVQRLDQGTEMSESASQLPSQHQTAPLTRIKTSSASLEPRMLYTTEPDLVAQKIWLPSQTGSTNQKTFPED